MKNEVLCPIIRTESSENLLKEKVIIYFSNKNIQKLFFLKCFYYFNYSYLVIKKLYIQQKIKKV